MIEIRNLTKTFGTFKALDDLTLTVPKGAVYGLVGPNGAGKSTVIRHMTGVYRPDSGTVTLEGQEFELLSYDCTDSHFDRGITAIWRYGSMVLVADIACADTLELDLRQTMVDFLAGFHYA